MPAMTVKAQRFSNSVLADIKDGIVVGLIVAVVLSAIAIAIYGLRGPATFDRVGASLSQVLLIYLTGGICIGAFFGAFRRFLGMFAGVIVLSLIAAALLMLIIYSASFGLPNKWDQVTWISFGIGTLLSGAIGVYLLRPRAK